MPATAAPARSVSTATRSAPVSSQLGQLAGREVATVEGLADGDELRPVQAAFLRTGAAQCGICTPGMLMAADALLATRSRIRRSLL